MTQEGVEKCAPAGGATRLEKTPCLLHVASAREGDEAVEEEREAEVLELALERVSARREPFAQLLEALRVPCALRVWVHV